MNKSKVNWVALAMAVTIGVVLVAHSLLPPPKARAQRIQLVNSSPKISFTWTNVAVSNSDAFPMR
jgi:hypothetical protein